MLFQNNDKEEKRRRMVIKKRNDRIKMFAMYILFCFIELYEI